MKHETIVGSFVRESQLKETKSVMHGLRVEEPTNKGRDKRLLGKRGTIPMYMYLHPHAILNIEADTVPNGLSGRGTEKERAGKKKEWDITTT